MLRQAASCFALVSACGCNLNTIKYILVTLQTAVKYFDKLNKLNLYISETLILSGVFLLELSAVKRETLS
jgi:hypothetical protein